MWVFRRVARRLESLGNSPLLTEEGDRQLRTLLRQQPELTSHSIRMIGTDSRMGLASHLRWIGRESGPCQAAAIRILAILLLDPDEGVRRCAANGMSECCQLVGIEFLSALLGVDAHCDEATSALPLVLERLVPFSCEDHTSLSITLPLNCLVDLEMHSTKELTAALDAGTGAAHRFAREVLCVKLAQQEHYGEILSGAILDFAWCARPTLAELCLLPTCSFPSRIAQIGVHTNGELCVERVQVALAPQLAPYSLTKYLAEFRILHELTLSNSGVMMSLRSYKAVRESVVSILASRQPRSCRFYSPARCEWSYGSEPTN